MKVKLSLNRVICFQKYEALSFEESQHKKEVVLSSVRNGRAANKKMNLNSTVVKDLVRTAQ